VLIVEDNKADAELVVATLKRGGFALAYDIVDAPEVFEQRLQQTAYDLILCDHNMVNWTGMDALETLHRLEREIPFIVVTATLGDEAAVDYIKRGAQDYVLKHRLQHLTIAVARALRDKNQRDRTRKLQEAILGAKQEWELTFDAVPDIVLLLDEESCIARANRAAAERAGVGFSQMIGKPCKEVLQCWDGLPGECPQERIRQTGKEERGEIEMPHCGKVFEATVSPLRERTGPIQGAVCVMRDITARKQGEEALRQSEARYRGLFENARDAVFTMDLQGTITSFNKMGEAITGYTREEVFQMHFSQMVAPEYLAEATRSLEQALAGVEQHPLEIEIIRKDGRRVPLEVSQAVFWRDQKPAGFQGIARDLTARKKLEMQLMQAQKMEAIGRLAGGIAHDFNNMMNIIMGYSQLMLERLPPQDPQIRLVKECRKAGERAVSLTRQLLAFSRKQVLRPRVVNLNEVIPETEEMLRHLLGENIELETILDPALGRVKVDPGQMVQVIMNLVVNARDAMPQGGKIRIETENAEIDEAYVRMRPPMAPGRYVRLTVTDSGEGIDPEAQQHIFEPFFTTKMHGTGLGLATVHGIVQQSGGFIWVYSEPGKGTSFKIYLPYTAERPAANQAELFPSRLPQGKEAILVVEDEEALRELTCEFLESGGYTALRANDGLAALQAMEKSATVIALVITDVVMPGMSGWELAQRLRQARPELKVIFVSGYSDEELSRQGALKRGVTLLEKPFTPKMLMEKVHEILTEGAPNPVTVAEAS